MGADLSNITQRLRAAYKQRSQRERIWIILAALALVLGLWDSLIHLPLQNKTKHAQEQLQQLQQQSAKLQQAITLLQSQTGESSVDKQKRLVALEREVQARQLVLQEASSGLVSPQRMAKVLKQVLAQSRRLQLIQMRTLPPQPWGKTTAASASTTLPMVYQHGIELELQGDYFAILEYVQQVETLPGFYWDALDYEVTAWPVATVRIRLYTLGLQEAILGA